MRREHPVPCPESCDECEERSLEARPSVEVRLCAKLAECERKAWDSLARYKFIMFGYWAAQWVLCRSVLDEPRANPFADLVRVARGKVQS
jgi:hypothetical protein